MNTELSCLDGVQRFDANALSGQSLKMTAGEVGGGAVAGFAVPWLSKLTGIDNIQNNILRGVAKTLIPVVAGVGVGAVAPNSDLAADIKGGMNGAAGYVLTSELFARTVESTTAALPTLFGSGSTTSAAIQNNTSTSTPCGTI